MIYEIHFINKTMADEIIETREPLGLFILRDGETFVGIDNSTGNAWTEEFKTKTAA